MRLAEHALHCYRLRYERPVQWSDIVEEAAPFVLLRLQSDTGFAGVAEITVKPTWCGVTARSLVTTIEEIFLPLLRTVDLDDPVKVRALLDRIPENQAAKTLIDNACWDLHAAATAGLVAALGRIGPGRGLVGAHAAGAARNGRRGGRDGGPSRLSDAQGQGRPGPRGRRRRHAEIRSAVGDGVRLYVDANGAYSADQAADYSRAMADAGAMMVEDPCALIPDAGFRKLQQDVRCRCSSISAAPRCAMPACFSLRCEGAQHQTRTVRALDLTRHGRACATVRLRVRGRSHGRKHARDIGSIAIRCGVARSLIASRSVLVSGDDRAGHRGGAQDC